MPDLDSVMIKDSTYNRSSLKRRLLQEGILKNECSKCGQNPQWNGIKLVLVLDHINGESNDHRLENLRLLCPNCNSQQSTFAGKNIKTDKRVYKQLCPDCSKTIGKLSKLCINCTTKKRRKIKDRPTIAVLKKQIAKLGYCGTGRKYGVSDNAIRKWMKTSCGISGSNPGGAVT